MLAQERNDDWKAHVRIEGTGGMAKVFIDGRQVPGVVAYTVAQDAWGGQEPVLTLRVRCDLDLDCGAIPLLPEPWTWVYQCKVSQFEGRGEGCHSKRDGS